MENAMWNLLTNYSIIHPLKKSRRVCAHGHLPDGIHLDDSSLDRWSEVPENETYKKFINRFFTSIGPNLGLYFKGRANSHPEPSGVVRIRPVQSGYRPEPSGTIRSCLDGPHTNQCCLDTVRTEPRHCPES